MSSLRRLRPMSTWRASNLRLRRQPRVQSRSKTGFGEFVRVAITQFDLDPTIFDGLVQPSLEIGISHIDEIIASKYAARTNFMLHENVEDLASHFFIRCHVIHPLRVSNRRSHKLNTTASSGMKLYSSCFGTDRPRLKTRMPLWLAIVQCAVSVAASSSTGASSRTAAAVVVVSSHSIRLARHRAGEHLVHARDRHDVEASLDGVADLHEVLGVLFGDEHCFDAREAWYPADDRLSQW